MHRLGWRPPSDESGSLEWLASGAVQVEIGERLSSIYTALAGVGRGRADDLDGSRWAAAVVDTPLTMLLNRAMAARHEAIDPARICADGAAVERIATQLGLPPNTARSVAAGLLDIVTLLGTTNPESVAGRAAADIRGRLAALPLTGPRGLDI